MIAVDLLSLSVAAVLGLAFGSFGNVLLVRIAEASSIRGRSRCPKCRHQLAWYDLVPLFSYLFLAGRCRYCRKPIAWLYPAIEFAAACLFVLAVVLSQGNIALTIGVAIFLWGLLLAGVYDARSGLLPDMLTGIATFGALIIAFAHGDFVDALIGLLIGAGWFGWQWLISRGRAVGSGDILLGGCIGLALGMWGTVIMLVVSYIVGAFVSIILLASGKVSRGSQIPFGPFLAIGALLTLIGIGDVYIMFLTRTF